jgi:hypothetical protein
MKPILTVLAFCGVLAAQPPTSVPPACNIEFNFTQSGQISVPLNNIYVGCSQWYVYYSSYDVMGLSFTVQSAPDLGNTPGTFVSFIGPLNTTPYSTTN